MSFFSRHLFIHILLILALCASCGLKTTKEIHEKNVIAGVDLDGSEGPQNPTQVKLVTGGGSTKEFGPAPDGVEINGPQSALPVVALSLGPGLYRSFLHINVLKSLERHEIKPNVLTGSGMGAVIASLYAFSLTPDLIEWRVFNFLSQVKDEKVLSQAWLEKVDQVLLKDYLNANIEDADKVLRLAVLDTKTNKVEMKLRGSLRELIRAQFSASASGDQKYIAPHLRSIFHQTYLKEGGVDFIIAIDALGPSFKLKKRDDYWSGIWGRTVGLSKKEREGIEAALTLPSRGLALDNEKAVSKYIEKSLPSITDSVGRLKTVLDNWERPASPEESGKRWYEFDQDFFIGENED